MSSEVADLSRRSAAVDGSFRALGLDGNLALTAALIGNSELVVPHLRMQAAGSTIDGDLRVALTTGLLQGTLAARLPDLSRWSGLAGRPLGGSLELNANFGAQGGGQGLRLSVSRSAARRRRRVLAHRNRPARGDHASRRHLAHTVGDGTAGAERGAHRRS